jgi:excisionase family DNA binding protein
MLENLIILQVSRDELKSLIHEEFEVFRKDYQPIEVKDDKIERLFSIADLSKLFGVHRTTINEWMKSGKLVYHRIGGRIYFKEFEVYNAMQKFDLSKSKNFGESRKWKI